MTGWIHCRRRCCGGMPWLVSVGIIIIIGYYAANGIDIIIDVGESVAQVIYGCDSSQ